MRYLVKNNRPRRTVSLFGRVLASSVSGGAGTMLLTEEQWQSPSVQTQVENKRIVLLHCVDDTGGKVQAGPPPVKETKKAAPAPKPEPAPTPPPAPEPVELEVPVLDEDTDEDSEDLPSFETAPEETGDSTRREDLELLERQELQDLAKNLSVKASGKSADIITRILRAEAPLSEGE